MQLTAIETTNIPNMAFIEAHGHMLPERISSLNKTVQMLKALNLHKKGAAVL